MKSSSREYLEKEEVRERRDEEVLFLPMGTIFADLLIGEFASENFRTDLRQVQGFQRLVDAINDGVEEFHGVVLFTKVHCFSTESRHRDGADE